MNRFLGFNPEPFESGFELENLSQVYGSTKGGSENETEWEYVGARGRNLRFRKPSASSLPEAAISAGRRATQGPPPAKRTIQQTVYGWSRYKRRVEELPADQQAVLKAVGNAVIASYGPGGQPVRNVKVYGHADYDTPRNPQREQQYSEDRAKAATDWLKSYVGASIAWRISWDTKGLGATQLKAPPTSEANRRQNRRVEILGYYSSTPMCVEYPPPNIPQFTLWLNKSLNAVLGIRLSGDGTDAVATRRALRSFQENRGLASTGQVDRATQVALHAAGAPIAPFVVNDTPKSNDNTGTWFRQIFGGSGTTEAKWSRGSADAYEGRGVTDILGAHSISGTRLIGQFRDIRNRLECAGPVLAHHTVVFTNKRRF